MKLHDAGKIVAGIVVFVALATFPFWWGRGGVAPPPDLSLDTPEIRALADKRCIEDKAFMRERHMKLLDEWRNAVVRDGQRVYVSTDGRAFSLSLTDTCLSCHANKAQFCDACHDYAGVAPKCYDCHPIPGEAKP